MQAGVAFGGPIKKDKTYYFFSYEITRRHETGFSSIGQDNFGLTPFDTSAFFGAPPAASVCNSLPSRSAFSAESRRSRQPSPASPAYAGEVGQYLGLAGASSGWPCNGAVAGRRSHSAAFPGVTGFPTSCAAPPVSDSRRRIQTLASQEGNFPVFEGTSLYSLRLDHNLSTNHRLIVPRQRQPQHGDGH